MMDSSKMVSLLDEHFDLLAASQDPKVEPALKMLGLHLENPRSYVALVGETSSGKSTLVNSFLGRKLLPAGAKPTTGTVTWIEYGLADRDKFLAINRDATVEELSPEKFLELSERPDANLLRLKAEIPERRAGFKGLNVFDTPGFNAIIAEHAEVLKEFLPESDVVVFPVSYKVGFGESDQKLMELIYEVRQDFGEFPVVLVVNRAPDGIGEDDRRVREIRLHAEDSLHDKVRLVIVQSSMPKDGVSVLPETEHLWREVHDIAFAPERKAEIESRFRTMFVAIVAQRIGEIAGKLEAVEIGQADIRYLQEQKSVIGDLENEAIEIVGKYARRLTSELPRFVRNGTKSLMDRVEHETGDTNKWTDASQCRAFIYGHVLPFGISDVAKGIEAYLREIYHQMDAELDEKANGAIRKLESRAQTVKNPELGKLLLNIGSRIASRLGGDMAKVAVQGFGGVGGAAAGMGNLAKMAVKQVGKLFGKTFGREVYTNIGKIFTKRFVQTMGACLQVAVEAAFLAWDANHWQGELKSKARETVGQWEDEALAEIKNAMIPEFLESNLKSVKECYAVMQSEIDNSIANAQRSYREDELTEFRAQLSTLATIKNELKG